MMVTSSSSTSSPSHPTSSQKPWFVKPEKKICACQRLGELFGLTVPATEQACFEAAWEKCKESDWTLLKRCQEELNQIVNEQGRSLLQQAIRVGEIALATEMIANGIAIHARDAVGNTAMHYAVQTESLNLVLKLYEHTSQDARNEQGQTPLHYAAARGQLDVIRTLIANGANLGASTQVPIHDLNANATLSIGDLTLPNLTPLAFAAIRGDRDCVDLFLSENKNNPALNLNLRFGTIGNLLHLLITFHHSHLLEFVLSKYSEEILLFLNERDPSRGLTPFMLAAYLGNERALVLLKEAPVEEKYKVNLEATDFFGRTAVHHAVLGRQIKSLSYLHSFGVNLMPLDRGEPRKIPLNLLEGFDDTESKSICGHLSNLCDRDAKTQHALPNFVIDPPENLVFKGNDPTGLAYLGVIKALESKGKINGIKRAAGSSTGALIATLFSLGYSSDEIASKAKILSNFFDTPLADQQISAVPKDSPEYATVARLSDIIQKQSPLGKDQFKTLHQLPSFCTGVSLLNWLKECIDEKTGKSDCTFGELRELVRTNPQFKHLMVFTTCFGNTLTLSRFSSEDRFFDDIVISHAVCAALSVPGIFPLKSLYSKNKAGGMDESFSLGLHGDAGLINNFSIEAYDREKYQSVMPLGEEAEQYFRLNKRTLGFAFETQQRQCSIPETATVKQFLEKVLSFYCQMDPSMQEATLYNRFRVVQIAILTLEGLSSFPHEEQMKRFSAIGEEVTVGLLEAQERDASSQNPFINTFERTNQGNRWKNLKAPLSYFVGRTHQLTALKERLIPAHVDFPTSSSSSSSSGSSSSSSGSSSSTSMPPAQKRACIVLAGAEGMGKSETAIAFAHQYRENFSVVWWIETATPQSMDRSFRQLAEALDIYIELTSSAETTRRRIYHFLNTENLGKPYLLIFDNAEESIELPEGDNGRILITTTQPSHFLMGEILMIEPLTQDESINLVAGILKEEPNEEMRRLAAEVEYLPAILSQAAQYIRTTSGMTLSRYLELLSKEKVKVLSMMSVVDSRYSKAQLFTWKITHEKLMQEYPIAYEWLEICAHLQPDAIPSSYLETWLECFQGEQDYVERSIKKDQILRPLVNGGILRYDQKSDSYSLHRIRQEMIKQLLVQSEGIFTQNSSSSNFSSTAPLISEHSSYPSRHKAIALLAAIANQLDMMSTFDWMPFAPHEVHIRAIFESMTDTTDDSEEIASMSHFLGRWLLTQGNSQEARLFLRKALQIRTRLLPSDHPHTANTLDALGRAFAFSLRNQRKRFYIMAAYKMRKRIYQGDHIEIAISLNHLAFLQDVEDKEMYIDQAIEMWRRVCPHGHPFMAEALGFKAHLLRVSKRLDEAYNLAREALQILEKISGNSLGNRDILGNVFAKLGDILDEQGQHGEALSYFKKTLDLYVKINPRHGGVFSMIISINRCYHKLDNLPESIAYFTQYIDSNMVPGNDSNISRALICLGIGNYEMKKYDEGYEQITRSILMHESYLDDGVTFLLEMCHQKIENHREAAKSLTLVLGIARKLKLKKDRVSGFNDLDIAMILKCLGTSLEALGEHQKARECFGEATAISPLIIRGTNIGSITDQKSVGPSTSAGNKTVDLSSSGVSQVSDETGVLIRPSKKIKSKNENCLFL